MKLGRLRAGHLRIVEPFEMVIYASGSGFIAEAPEVSEFGIGGTRAEALRDLQFALQELYGVLDSHRHQLGPGLSRTLEIMGGKIRVLTPTSTPHTATPPSNPPS